MGTTSLKKALVEKGLKVYHGPTYGVKSHLKECDSAFFEGCDYFLDGSFHNIINLRKWFPNAKFVLLERDSLDWICSVINWMHNIDQRQMSKDKWLVKLNRFFINKWVITNMLITYKLYHIRVINYFIKETQFFRVNLISGGSKAWESLSSFLDVELVPRNENTQQKNINISNLEPLNLLSNKKIETQNHYYPQINSGIRYYLFRRSMNFLGNHFIKERHFLKNIEKATKGNHPIYDTLKHVFLFGILLWWLGVRVFATRSYVISPYLY